MIALLLTSLLAASPAPTGAHPLRQDLAFDLTSTAVVGAYWVSSETFLKKTLAPSKCRLCDRDAAGNDRRLGIDLLGMRLKAADPYLETTAKISDVIAYAALPLAIAGTHVFAANDAEALSALPMDALFVAQAVVTAGALNQTVKFIAGRSRPFVFRLGAGSPLSRHPEDDNLSFFSGHATFGFVVVAASATVAELRGYRLAKWIWVFGLPLAASLPVLRMAADKHYMTDVIIGSATGTLIGVLMPRKLHGRVGTVDVALSVGPQGAMLSGLF